MKYIIHHGLSKHPLYAVHSSMIQRCHNPNFKGYENYGGRGITVCEEWEDHFINFYNWAINNGWQKGLTLDRINNNEGYSPENCRYVSYKTNLRNRRSNNLVTMNGVTRCLQEWADILGVTAMTLYYRLKRGIPVDKALTSERYIHSKKQISA